MCLPLWKVPDITNLQVVDLILPSFVYSRDTDRTRVNVAPFRLQWDQSGAYSSAPKKTHDSVPMQLPQSPFCQMLLSSSNVFTGGQIGHNLFPDPASRKEPRLRIRKAPFEIRDYSVVGSLSAKVIRILEV